MADCIRSAEPTIYSIGIEWELLPGTDSDHNAVCEVEYKLKNDPPGAVPRKATLPRIDYRGWYYRTLSTPVCNPSDAAPPSDSFDSCLHTDTRSYTDFNVFAGSLMFLEPNTTYSLTVNICEDGSCTNGAVVASQSFDVQTRAVPMLQSPQREFHVTGDADLAGDTSSCTCSPLPSCGTSGRDGSATNPFFGFAEAEQCAQPGDVFRLGAGRYRGHIFRKSGAVAKYIAWKGDEASGTEIILAAPGDDGAQSLVLKADHLWFEGLKLAPKFDADPNGSIAGIVGSLRPYDPPVLCSDRQWPRRYGTDDIVIRGNWFNRTKNIEPGEADFRTSIAARDWCFCTGNQYQDCENDAPGKLPRCCSGPAAQDKCYAPIDNNNNSSDDYGIPWQVPQVKCRSRSDLHRHWYIADNTINASESLDGKNSSELIALSYIADSDVAYNRLSMTQQADDRTVLQQTDSRKDKSLTGLHSEGICRGTPVCPPTVPSGSVRPDPKSWESCASCSGPCTFTYCAGSCGGNGKPCIRDKDCGDTCPGCCTKDTDFGNPCKPGQHECGSHECVTSDTATKWACVQDSSEPDRRCFCPPEEPDGLKITSAMNIDVYGNDMRDLVDDAIEADAAYNNIRIWRNRVLNSSSFFSLQPMLGAPWYVVRNEVITSSGIELPAYGKSRSAGSILKPNVFDKLVLVNNTFVVPNGKYAQGRADVFLRSISRNNLWIQEYLTDCNVGGAIWQGEGDCDYGGPGAIRGQSIADWKTDIDYDGFDWDTLPDDECSFSRYCENCGDAGPSCPAEPHCSRYSSYCLNADSGGSCMALQDLKGASGVFWWLSRKPKSSSEDQQITLSCFDAEVGGESHGRRICRKSTFGIYGHGDGALHDYLRNPNVFPGEALGLASCAADTSSAPNICGEADKPCQCAVDAGDPSFLESNEFFKGEATDEFSVAPVGPPDLGAYELGRSMPHYGPRP